MRFRSRSRTHAPLSCTRHETTEMMTISGGFCGDVGAPLQTAAHVVEPALMVTAMSAVLRAGLPTSASDARVAASASPAPVKYSIVSPAADRPAENRQATDRNLRQATELTPS
jgi:hypothetical protein